ncbi:MAG: hypothetical protein EKK34_18325 [Mycobacterium sp.]|nr:MAG: hypothetical protein EKK34_18325 [Mycobacterium sp.]
MKEFLLRNKVVFVAAVLAGIASAGMTFLSWGKFGDTGLSWNAFGVYTGERNDYFSTVGPPMGEFINTGPGWTVLIASIAATVALTGATRTRRLGLVAPVFALIAFVAVVACIVRPTLLMGELRDFLGAGADPERAFVNSAILIAEASATGILLICSVLLAITTIRQARRSSATDSGLDA